MPLRPKHWGLVLVDGYVLRQQDYSVLRRAPCIEPLLSLGWDAHHPYGPSKRCFAYTLPKRVKKMGKSSRVS